MTKLLTVARLVKRKNINKCMEIHKRLRELSPGELQSWIVVGRGPLEYELMASLHSGTFHFLNYYVPKDNLLEFYRTSDVFVLPSVNEGFGMVYVESIINGCPVVCLKGEGGEEIVNKTGGGVAISGNNIVEEGVKAIQTILGDKERYINLEVIEKAKKLVDKQEILNKWKEIIG